MAQNNEFLDQYSFEDLCKQIEPLSIYDNPYDQFIFVKAVIAVLDNELKRERGEDILKLTTPDEIASYTKLVLKEHPGLETDVALIVVTHAIKSEIARP